MFEERVLWGSQRGRQMRKMKGPRWGLTVGNRLQLYRLWDAFLVPGSGGLAAHLRFEEGVHHCGLAKAALPCGGKQGEMRAAAMWDLAA